MTKNPVLNALGASTYIFLVSTIMHFITQTQRGRPDTFFTPIAILSLFTLSAAVMAYLFFYQPVQLFVEGKKREAINLFVKTVGVFAVFTVVIWILLLSGLI